MSSRADLSRLQRRSDAVSLAVVVAHLGFALTPVYLAAIAGPRPVLVLLWLWLGLSMHALLNLLHESAHALVFRSRPANELLGRWLLGPLVFADFDGYRDRHWAHHRHFGAEGDTKDTYLISIRGWRLPWLVLRCLALREAGRRWLVLTRQGAPPPGALGRTLLVQAVLSSSLLAVALAVHPDAPAALAAALVAYLGVYVYGIGSLTTLTASLRTIAEHQQGLDGAPTEGRAALRNFTCGPLERLVLGAYGFAEHATHHREPAVPAYHLPALTERLGAADPGLLPRRGYVATLALLVSGSPS